MKMYVILQKGPDLKTVLKAFKFLPQMTSSISVIIPYYKVSKRLVLLYLKQLLCGKHLNSIFDMDYL